MIRKIETFLFEQKYAREFSFLGEFRSPLQEHRFLLWRRESTLKRMRLICCFSGLIYLLALAGDYGALSLTPPFLFLLGMRGVLGVAGVVLGCAVTEKNFFSWFSGALLGYMLLFGVTEALEMYLKGVVFTAEHTPFILFMVLSYYLFIPARVPFAVAAGVGTSLLYLGAVSVLGILPSPVFPVFCIYFALVNVVGCATLSSFSRIQRKEFLLLQKQRKTNRRLIEEIAQRKKMEAALREMAQKDGLTGLFNRRSFFDRLRSFWKEPVRCLGFLMMDLDYFKKINDEYGHPAGDAVLLEAAERFREALPPQGVLGRLGGEEFGVLLPECILEELLELGERLRKTLEEGTFETPWGDLYLTVSLGGALGFPGEDLSSEASFHRADSALLQAKQQGRNCFYYMDQEGHLSCCCGFERRELAATS